MADIDLILELSNISFAYRQEVSVLNDLNLSLRRGEKIGLVGENGSGKTTLLNVVIGLRKFSSGSLKLFGKEVVSKKDYAEIRRKVGLLFQDADDQLFCPTVIEDVAFGPLNQGKPVQEAEEISKKVLHSLGISGLEKRITHQLSGGEKKLVSLATILAMSPEILLLDEPTSGLDRDTKKRIAEILRALDLSYIVISHEYDFLAEVTDYIYLMKDGCIIADEAEKIHSHYHVHSFGEYPHEHSS